MNIKELTQKVKDLNLPLGHYVLFGSAPLGIHGLKECRDIDVVISDFLWDEYKNKPEWQIKRNMDRENSFCLCKDNVEFWRDWAPGYWDVKKLIDEAEIIDNIPFVSLEKVIEWKKLNAREKDLKDIKIIEDYLKK